MNGFILLLLIVGVIYIAMTYFKGTKNTNTYSDGFTTRPYGGMDQMSGRPDGLQPGQPEDAGYEDEADGTEDRNDNDGAAEALEDSEAGDVPADEEEGRADAGSKAGGDAEAFNAAAVPAARAAAFSAAVEPGSGETAADAADTAGKPATGTSDQTAATFSDPFADTYHLSDSGVQIDSQVQLDAQMPSDPGSTDNQQ